MQNTLMLITSPATGRTTVVSLSKRTGEMKSSDPMDSQMVELLTRYPDAMADIDCRNEFDGAGLGKHDIISQW